MNEIETNVQRVEDKYFMEVSWISTQFYEETSHFLLELEGHFYLLALFCEYFLTTWSSSDWELEMEM